jgi:hypothetical protein
MDTVSKLTIEMGQQRQAKIYTMDIQPTRPKDPPLRELYRDSVIKFDKFDDVLKYLRYK